MYDRKPSARPYRKIISGWARRWNPSGNVYSLDAKEFKGLFLVDEGVLYGYSHPASLKTGGFPFGLPAFVKTTDGKSEKPGSHDSDTEDGE